MKILGLKDILKVGDVKYTVLWFGADIKLEEVDRGNLSQLTYSDFEEKLNRHELEIIPGL